MALQSRIFVLFCLFTLGLYPSDAWVILSGVGPSMDRHVMAGHQDRDLANSNPLKLPFKEKSVFWLHSGHCQAEAGPKQDSQEILRVGLGQSFLVKKKKAKDTYLDPSCHVMSIEMNRKFEHTFCSLLKSIMACLLLFWAT